MLFFLCSRMTEPCEQLFFNPHKISFKMHKKLNISLYLVKHTARIIWNYHEHFLGAFRQYRATLLVAVSIVIFFLKKHNSYAIIMVIAWPDISVPPKCILFIVVYCISVWLKKNVPLNNQILCSVAYPQMLKRTDKDGEVKLKPFHLHYTQIFSWVHKCIVHSTLKYSNEGAVCIKIMRPEINV